MSISVYWKRVPAGVIAGAGPGALTEMVPSFSDEDFDSQEEAGTLVGVEDTGELIADLLRLRASDDAGRAAAKTFSRPPADWDEDYMVGSLPPDAVAQIGRFVAGVSLGPLTSDENVAFEAEDADRVEQALSDAVEVVALFRAAAAAGDAVIFRVLA